MPFILPGMYCDTGDKAYEVESSYYLEFQIKSALISIKKIKSFTDEDFDSKYQYYHYYTDHLLYSMGQIGNRFIIKKGDKGLTLERKEENRQNFEFSESIYPILSNKAGRNTIEHIDEHNQKVIVNNKGVGGFNLIDIDTDKLLIETLYNERQTHPYILDLLNDKILIIRNEKEIDIRISDLEQELTSLLNSVSYVYKYLTEDL